MTIQRRTAIVTIYGGDYLDRIRHLEARAQAAKDAAGDRPRMNDEIPEWMSLAEEHDALVAEAEAQALHVKVQALKRGTWKALVGEHPPRDDNKGDQRVGVNEDAFKEVLVSYVNPDDPEDRTIAEGIDLDDLPYLADIDFDRLYLTAFAQNRGAVAGPKAGLVSRMSQESDETSN